MVGIPVFAILDPTCDRDVVDYPSPGTDAAFGAAGLLPWVVAAAGAAGLPARAGAGGAGDKPEAEGAEPLAEWEQELLATATSTVAASSGSAEGAEPGTPAADIQTEPKTSEGS